MGGKIKSDLVFTKIFEYQKKVNLNKNYMQLF